MRAAFAIVAAAIGVSPIGPAAGAQESYKAEPLSEAPPEELADPIREALDGQGIRILDADGEPVLDLWLRSKVPAKGEITGPASSVLFPFLQAGELVGAVRLAEDTGDYKAQSILPGVYTARYGLQPVDGDHLGVSNYRDYVLLSMADEDVEAEPITQDDLQSLSTGPSGTNHPSVFLLLPAPEGAEAPAIVRDGGQDRTGLAVTLPVAVEGEDEPQPVTLLMVFEGAGPH